MNDHNYFQINLPDGTVFYGFKDEYISKVIGSTLEYYEIHDLRKFSKYIPSDPIVYDIGSNIGNHTIYFSKYLKAKKIYSFEPVPMNADLLEKNINENKLTNIEVHRVAVGNTSGKADLVINEQNMGQCKLVKNPEGTVPVVTIDEMKLEVPTFIKIDVEGTELDVLGGMTKILETCSPVIWIEINDYFHEVDRFLSQYQYELVDKHNFNHIYVKCESVSEQLENMQMFKENIVLEFNQTVLDKWNVNTRLSSEQEKVKKLNSQMIENKSTILQLNKENERLNKENERLNKENERLNKENERLNKENERLNKENEQLNKENERLNKENELLNKENERQNKENEDLKTRYNVLMARYPKLEQDSAKLAAELEQTIDSKNKEILNRLDSEENTLKHYKNAIFEYSQLEAKYANISKKYDLLSKAKLGKLTLKYWKFKKRIPEDF